MDLATIDAKLAKLREYRATGLSRVAIGADGHTETAWKSDTELAAAEAALLRERAALTGTAVTTIRVTATKGLE